MPITDKYVAVLRAIDELAPDDMQDHELEFLNCKLIQAQQCRDAPYGPLPVPLTDRQARWIRRLGDRYLGTERTAELLGQQQLFERVQDAD